MKPALAERLGSAASGNVTCSEEAPAASRSARSAAIKRLARAGGGVVGDEQPAAREPA